MLIYDSHQTEDQEDVFFWATQMHALTPPSAAVCGSHGAGPRRPGLATIDAMIATWLRTMETMDTMHTMDSKTKPRQSIFGGIFFFRTSELLSQCFSARFCHCCASEGPTPNRKTWPLSHWLFVVAGKSWKGVLAISSASTGCLGRILK